MPAWTITHRGPGSRVLRDEQRTCTQQLVMDSDPVFWQQALDERAALLKTLAKSEVGGKLDQLAAMILDAFQGGGRIFLFGNGGSAAAAQHIAAEFVGRFLNERAPLPAVSLTTDTSVLTAVGNDYGFERMFERQVDALVQAGDVVIGLTTSGNSDNVVRGLRAARRRDARTAALLGRTTGRVGRAVDLAIRVPSNSLPVIQEIHECFLHLVCESIDRRLTSRTAPSRTQTRRKGRG
ncbi:MAG: SIS domain-containing protein, partial [Vicinamibacterales bacterium]|nr:SIS domain-containing protein [Vicinamibacterales bacterium]